MIREGTLSQIFLWHQEACDLLLLTSEHLIGCQATQAIVTLLRLL